MVTVYLVVPTEQQKGYKSRIISSKAFAIERDLKQKPTSIQLIESKAVLEDPKLGGKFIKEPEPLIEKGVEIGTTEERYPELTFQGKELATLADGRKIVHAIVARLGQALPFIKCQSDYDPEDEDVLSKNNLKRLGVETQVIGYTREDVLKAYPELVGYTETEVDGEIVQTPKLMKHKWSGE